MELLKDNNPEESEYVKAFLKDVQVQEAKCFDRIFTRFCLLNAVKVDITRVEFDTNPFKPNYVGYYYVGKAMKSNHKRHFLMSRDLIIKPGEELPVLNISYNNELLDETKEN